MALCGSASVTGSLMRQSVPVSSGRTALKTRESTLVSTRFAARRLTTRHVTVAKPCKAQADSTAQNDDVSPVGQGPSIGKREFLACSTAAAASVGLGPWSVALAEGSLAVDDITGKPVSVAEVLQKAASMDRILVRGIDNNPTYLLVNDGKVADYALRAVCTHMGCTPDWVGADGRFECPCHGSQYNARGEVVEGPAPENLALVHVKIDNGKVQLDEWNEADFRNGETDPWWV